MPLGVQFVNVAREAGLRAKTIFGSENKNKYPARDHRLRRGLLRLRQRRLARYLPGQRHALRSASTPRAKRRPTASTRTIATARSPTSPLKAGLARTGWGQGVCAGDYDNDGHDDLFVTYWGDCALYHNNGNGTFTDVAAKAGVTTQHRHRSASAGIPAAPSSITTATATWICSSPTTSTSIRRPRRCRNPARASIKACWWPADRPVCKGGKNILFHNNGDGTFTDVSEKSGILKTPGTYGLGVLVADFDNDGWPDIYVANDSTSSALYKNNHDGTFTDIAIEAGVAYSADGKPQAGMGVSAADYDCDGNLDIVKTNFAGDTSSLYRNLGNMTFEDQTFQAGLGKNTRFLGWGVGFLDFDNDGWPDILICNGHVYPEVGETDAESGYRERKVLYRNLGNGKFADVSMDAGPGILEKVPGRGCAFGDFDNDGDIDVLVNCVNDVPQLLRCDQHAEEQLDQGEDGRREVEPLRHRRAGLSARPASHRQMDEVRSGGSYISQSDLRVHFGLGQSDQGAIWRFTGPAASSIRSQQCRRESDRSR